MHHALLLARSHVAIEIIVEVVADRTLQDKVDNEAVVLLWDPCRAGSSIKISIGRIWGKSFL